MLCLEVIAHSSLDKAKTMLASQLKTRHMWWKPSLIIKNIKPNRVDHPTTLGGAAYSCSKAELASFSVNWNIARAKASQTVGESLVKPATMEFTRMCGGATANKLGMVSKLSNTNIKWHIQEASVNILQNNSSCCKAKGKFCLHLDKTIDLWHDAQLMVFVQSHKVGVLNLFKHVAQLINRGSVANRLYNFSNVTTVCTCAEQKYKQLKTTCNNTTCTTINVKADPVCC